MYARMCSGDCRSQRSNRSRADESTSPTRKSTNHSDASSRIWRFNLSLGCLLFMSFPTLFLLKDVATLFQRPRQILLRGWPRDSELAANLLNRQAPKSMQQQGAGHFGRQL